MTTRTMSAETAPAAPRATAWDNMRGNVSNGGSIPPDSEQIWQILKNAARSLPPSSESIASPTDMDGESAIDTDAVVQTPEGTGEQTPEGAVVQTPEGTGEQTPEGAVVQTPEGTGEQTPEGAVVQTPEGTGEQTDESTRYEDRGRQIFDSAKAGIKGVAGKLVRLARGGAKTVGKTAGKGASVAVGFAAIEGPKAAKATAEKASKAIVESAQKISELAKSARERRKLRRNNREAAKEWRELEYTERQRARNEKLGKLATRAQIDAWAKAKIEEESAEHGGKIETLEASISGQKDALEMKEEEVRAAESRFRKAERRLNKLEAKRKRAEERRNQARDISNANPDDIDAKMALTRAEGDLRAIEEQYNAASTIKASLEGKKVDLSSELGTIRTGLGELQGKVNVEEDVIAAGKKWLRNNRVERLEDAASSAFTRVAEFVDGPTAAHDLLRRAGRAIKRKFKGGNRQEAKTTA